MTNEKLNTALYEKMFAEQEKFKDWLLSQPPPEILNHVFGLHRLVRRPRQDYRRGGTGRLGRRRGLAGRPYVPRPLRYPCESGPAEIVGG